MKERQTCQHVNVQLNEWHQRKDTEKERNGLTTINIIEWMKNACIFETYCDRIRQMCEDEEASQCHTIQYITIHANTHSLEHLGVGQM